MTSMGRILKITGLFLFLLSAGCGKDDNHPQIPDVPVSFVIDPNSTEYLELNHISGWIYLTGGYSGILVYRSGMTDFMAFERACPYDFQDNNARIDMEVSGITCMCPVCKSKYIITDGTPFEGPSHYPLKQYQNTFDGSLLYIYN
jgi:nitrite reductase/ring-hydroxylating ferredoxin subunit